jgi:hypothetical protein
MEAEQQIHSTATPAIAPQTDSDESRPRRGGKRPGGGRKPNLAKRLLSGLKPISAADALEGIDVRAIVHDLLKKGNPSRTCIPCREPRWNVRRCPAHTKRRASCYVPGAYDVGSIIVGYYKASKLICAGDTEASIREAASSYSGRLSIWESSRNRERPLGAELTAVDMKKCVWVRPEVVANRISGTDGEHLGHSKFRWLREDKNAHNVIKERVDRA